MAYPFLLGTPTSHPGMKKEKNHQHKAMFGFSEAQGKERIGEKGKQIYCLVEMNRGKGKENWGMSSLPWPTNFFPPKLGGKGERRKSFRRGAH